MGMANQDGKDDGDGKGADEVYEAGSGGTSENERASRATGEISGCAIDWHAGDANAQPTSTSVD